MKNFTFKTNNNINTFSFPESTNYSKILDDLIANNIKENNKYLTDAIIKHDLGINTDTIVIGNSLLKSDDKFAKAANFLANYAKFDKRSIPFKFGKVYKLANGTPIIFYDDEIQIGFDLFSYTDFANFNFINSLSENTKKTIIEIYANGYKIEIKL